MSLEVGIILLGLAALIVDFFTSSLLLPRLSIYGQRSEFYDEELKMPELIGQEAKARVYQMALQSDEARELEFENGGLVMRITVCGAGAFLSPNIRAFIGPYELQGRWLEPGRSVELEVPVMRPHKTWLFRCFVTGDVEEMEVSVRVRTKWPVRRFLMQLSRNIFHYDLPIDEKRIVFRAQEDRELSTAFRSEGGWLFFRLAFLAVFGGLTYHFFMQFGRERLGITQVTTPQPWESWLAGILVLFAALALHRLSRRQSLPIGQGYEIGRIVEIQRAATSQSKRTGD